MDHTNVSKLIANRANNNLDLRFMNDPRRIDVSRLCDVINLQEEESET